MPEILSNCLGLCYNKEKRLRGEEMLVLFDLGGSAVKYGLWENETLQATSQFKTPTTWAAMKAQMKEVFDGFAATNKITGVSLAAPGVVDVDQSVIRGISAIPYIHHFDIFTELTELFGVPVTIENDANCAALAEVYKGVAVGKKDVLFVVVGSGVGGAVIHDGLLMKGQHLYGGEFGLMYMTENATLSNLGTAVNMANRYCERKNLPLDSVSGKDVFAAAEGDDAIAKEEVETFYHYLARGLYNLQFTTDPEMIILGGGISAKAGLTEELTRRVEADFVTLGLSDMTIDIQPCKYRNDANLIGAAVNFSLAQN